MDVGIGRGRAMPMGRGVEGRPAGKPARARNEQGQALVEFAFTLPLLLLIVFGIIAFGVTLNNYIVLQNAANASAQYACTRRGVTTNPCLDVSQTVYNVAPSLAPTQITFTIKVATGTSGSTSPPTYTYTSIASGVAGGTNVPSCSGDQSDMNAGYPIQVVLSYPCSLTGFAFNFPCKLTAQATYDIQ